MTKDIDDSKELYKDPHPYIEDLPRFLACVLPVIGLMYFLGQHEIQKNRLKLSKNSPIEEIVANQKEPINVENPVANHIIRILPDSIKATRYDTRRFNYFEPAPSDYLKRNGNYDSKNIYDALSMK